MIESEARRYTVEKPLISAFQRCITEHLTHSWSKVVSKNVIWVFRTISGRKGTPQPIGLVNYTPTLDPQTVNPKQVSGYPNPKPVARGITPHTKPTGSEPPAGERLPEPKSMARDTTIAILP